MSDTNKRVTLYTTQFCGYCRAAKSLLDRQGVPVNTIDLTEDPEELMELKRRSGHSTVPLIFLDDELIGGYMELQAFIRTHGADIMKPKELKTS